MFGQRNVVRPSPRGGKGGMPIQAPRRASRGRAKAARFGQGSLGGRGGRGRVGARGGQARGRGMNRALGGRGRGPVRAARRPQYKRR